MSITLFNKNESMWIASHALWFSILSLAREYDWHSARTTDPLQPGCQGKWDGSYGICHGQLVAAGDALALGDAILAALVDTPDDPSEGWAVSGEFRAHILKLIDFCREGSFRIY